MEKIKKKDIQFRCGKHPVIIYEQGGNCLMCKDKSCDVAATQVFYCDKCGHWANVLHPLKELIK